MGVSDVIAGFIVEMLDSEDGCAELQRTELATRFNCVPSQISYVISTRFSPEHGYIVESRRGGGGYIRIRRVRQDPRQLVMHTINAIGNEVSFPTVRAFISNLLDAGAINSQAACMMMAALSQTTLKTVPLPLKESLRATIFKQMLVQVLGADSAQNAL